MTKTKAARVYLWGWEDGAAGRAARYVYGQWGQPEDRRLARLGWRAGRDALQAAKRAARKVTP